MATTVGASSSRRAGRSVGIAATVEDDVVPVSGVRHRATHVGREEHPAHAATDEFLLDAAGVAEGGGQTSQKVAHGGQDRSGTTLERAPKYQGKALRNASGEGRLEARSGLAVRGHRYRPPPRGAVPENDGGLADDLLIQSSPV